MSVGSGLGVFVGSGLMVNVGLGLEVVVAVNVGLGLRVIIGLVVAVIVGVVVSSGVCSAIGWPLATSHKIMVLSLLPEANILPSGLNATLYTESV